MVNDVTRITLDDNYKVIGEKIFKYFALGQSCTLKGVIIIGNDVISKGDAVIKEIEEWDKYKNTYPAQNGKQPRRKRVKPENSIGDYVAQKMFRYSKVTRDGKPVVIIWRMQ